jgi:hypothetical protein
MCRDFSTDSVVVTEGKAGYHVFCRNGQKQFFPGMDVPVKSALGAGDALFAGILSCFPASDWTLRAEAIQKFVLPVLQCETAVPGSNTNVEGFRMSPSAQQVLGGATFFLAALVFASLGYFSSSPSYGKAGVCFVLVALFAGISGGIMSGLIRRSRSVLQPDVFLPTEGLLGAVAGVIAAILFGLPYLTASGLLDQTVRIEILRNLMLYEFVFAVVAGLTFQPYLRRLVQNAELPYRLDKVDSALSSTPKQGGS